MKPATRAALRALRWGVTVVLWVGVAVLALHRSGYPVLLGRYSHEFAAFLVVATLFATATTAALWVLPGRTEWLRKARRNLAVPLLLLLVSLGLSMAALEGVLRTTDLFGASMYGEVRRYMEDLVPDDQLVVRQRPNLHTSYEGVDVRTNELGLRERPLSEIPAGPRILLLGNSVTFGWGVRQDETFGRLLEKRLGVATINTGVPGYNTTQAFRFLERDGDALHPDVVLVMYVGNDIDPLGPSPQSMRSFAGFREHPVLNVEYALGRSWAFSIFRHILPVLLTPPDPDPSAPGWRDSMASLQDIADWGQAHHVPVAVFLYRMTSDATTDLINDSISAMSQRDGFLYRDALPWFEGKDVRTLTNSFIDSHPNAAGHRILAEGMAQALAGLPSLQTDTVAGGP